MTALPPRHRAEPDDTGPVVGVDIGGSKIAAAIVGPDGAVLDRAVTATPSGASAVLEAVGDLVESLVVGPPGAVGVGAPGVVDTATGTVRSATDVLPGWAGTRVGPSLAGRWACPVVVDNDVRVMAYGELRHGAARDVDDVLFVSIGTGVGGAVVRRGQVDHGPHFTGGELAHLLVPRAGETPCGCGRRDHLEALAAGPAIEAAFRARRSDLALPAIAALARAGDADAAAVIAEAGAIAGRTIAGLVSALDVSAVVLGGGVSQIGAAFLDPFRDALLAEVLPDLRDIAVVAAALGTDAPLVGAAALAAGTVTPKGSTP